jgi:hypothetical protein
MGRQAPFVGVREYTELVDSMVYSHFDVPPNTFNKRPLSSSLPADTLAEEASDSSSSSIGGEGPLVDGRAATGNSKVASLSAFRV